jgi:quercetin dioxygenase-like cupin family protein
MDERAISGRFTDMDVEEPYPGVWRCSFDSDGATVTRYSFAAGASFPIHRHEQEQVTIVTAGSLTFTAEGADQEMQGGEWSVVAAGVEHGITAGPEGAEIIAMVVPRRAARDAYTVVGT